MPEKKKTKKNDPVDAVDELCSMDHGILSPMQARDLATRMGLDPKGVPIYAIEHHPEQVKGARLDGCTKIGEKRFAIGADELATWACRQLNLKYRDCFGRGSQLREACESLRNHFTGKPAEAGS